MSKPPVLKGWKDVVSTLWRIPLVKRYPGTNVSQVTSRVPEARAASWDAKIIFLPPPLPPSIIQNVYQLRTKPEVVRYLHASAGFPTKATWQSGVATGNYNSWP